MGQTFITASQIDNVEHVFDTVALMVASTDLAVGDRVKTLGYTAIGDGGGNEYQIVAAATGTADGGEYIDLATHQAKGLFTTGSKNIRQWGADPSATAAANKTAIQAALDAMSAGERLVVLDGSYSFSGQLLSTTNDITISGESRDGAVLVNTTNSSNTASLRFEGNDVRLEGFTVDGSALATDSSSTVAGCAPIELYNSSRCKVDGCTTIGGHYGIWLNNDTAAYNTNFRHKIINNRCRNNASSGIQLSQAEQCIVEGNDCRNSGTDGIKIAELSRHNRIIGNHCEGNTRDGIDTYDGFIESVLANNVCVNNTLQGFEVKGNYGGSGGALEADYVTRHSVVANNVAEGNGEPGFLFQQVRNMVISGNQSVSNSKDGYKLNNVMGCTFSGNVATRNIMHGFYLITAVTRNTFTGNQAIDNSWAGGTTQNGTYNGFEIASGSAGEFVGNVSTNGTTAGKKGGQGYGMNFGGGTSSVIGGYFDNNVTDDINGASNCKIIGIRNDAGAYINTFGSWSSNADAAVNGYVTFIDDTGTTRKLATIA